jgi:hypothetical protein
LSCRLVGVRTYAMCPPVGSDAAVKPLNAQLNPICHLLALLEAHHILHVSRIRVNGPVVTDERLWIFGGPLIAKDTQRRVGTRAYCQFVHSKFEFDG